MSSRRGHQQNSHYQRFSREANVGCRMMGSTPARLVVASPPAFHSESSIVAAALFEARVGPNFEASTPIVSGACADAIGHGSAVLLEAITSAAALIHTGNQEHHHGALCGRNDSVSCDQVLGETRPISLVMQCWCPPRKAAIILRSSVISRCRAMARSGRQRAVEQARKRS